MKKFLLLKVMLLLLFCHGALAQVTVSGRVTDAADGSPIPGVNIVEKGTTNGTVSDFDGNYTLSVAEGASIVFSFVGYVTQETLVAGRSTININLTTDVQQLSEVVVIGYGEVEERDATGAVATVSAEDFNQGVIASPEQLIQGRTAGVQITENSGEPGAGISIRIRGTSSVRSDNNPLFVVDGVPLGGGETSGEGSDLSFGGSSARNPLNFINPNDIESISILKDASAAAIYGSRGANGVVIITTKSGKGAGAGSLQYTSSISIANAANEFDLLGREAFLDSAEELGGNRSELDFGSNTDWQDEIFRTAVTHSHNLSFGGGNDNGDFRVSLGLLDQQGIIEESGVERRTARFNGSYRFLDDRLTVSTQMTVADVDDEIAPITNNAGFAGDLLISAWTANPTRPVRNPDGTFNQIGNDQLNPMAMLAFGEDNTNTLRTLANFSVNFDITEDLSFKTVLGFDRSLSSRAQAFSSDLVAANIEGVGRASFADIQINNRLVENYFNYSKELSSSVKLDALLGHSYQRFENSSRTILAQGFRTNDVNLMINNLSSFDFSTVDGEGGDMIGNSSLTEDEIQSFFTRANLNINDKYLITATVRADGSTRFGDDNRYGYFPSLALAWRLSDEIFVPEVFSDLKLRVGYGITGNQEIPNNLFQTRQRFQDFRFDNANVADGALTNVTFENPDIQWESTEQINIGLDYGFLDNRVRGSLEYYRKNTNDLLFRLPSAQPAPNEFAWENLDADVINEGVELSVEVDAIDNTDFSWDISANVSYNSNRVENFDRVVNTGEINGQGLSNVFAQRIAGGQPLYAYFIRIFEGFNENGESIYRDGDIQQFTGDSPLPDVIAGVTNRFNYKSLDFSFFFTGQFGQEIYNNTANALFTAGALGNGRNVTDDVPGNGESNLNAPDASTRFLENGSFVRLQNVTLGYSFDTSNWDFISSLRLFATGQNLLLFTDYSGLDPEVNVDGAIDEVPSFGIDYSAYPRARTFTFGVSASF